ncbi:MAG: hypothetical protein QOF90_2745 [Acetobacteraceae bacterium]|nr:hypothetical protein [Acetobacteraceae bacterium]
MRNSTVQNSASRATLVRCPAKEKLRFIKALRLVLHAYFGAIVSCPTGRLMPHWAVFCQPSRVALIRNVFHCASGTKEETI